MKKRNEEKEDAKRQQELDKVNAKLRYQQLDEFERMSLERRRQDLLNEQAEINFERSAENRKVSITAFSGADGLADDDYMVRLEYLSDIVTALCENAGISYDVTGQLSGVGFRLETIQGTDRRQELFAERSAEGDFLSEPPERAVDV